MVYSDILESMVTYEKLDAEQIRGKEEMRSLATYITQNEGVIAKFHNVNHQLLNFLATYNFSNGYNFGELKENLASLLLLREKLVTMSEQAKKLMAIPSRYGYAKSIESCRNLVIACREKLTLGEAKKLIDIVENNTNKLLEMSKKFNSDQSQLNEIRHLIQENLSEISMFKGFVQELNQYADSIFSPNIKDIEEVERRIKSVLQLKEKLYRNQALVKSITGYAERHNKNVLLAKHQKVVDDSMSVMRSADISRYSAIFDDLHRQFLLLIDAFGQDKQELRELQSLLKEKKPEIWSDDNETMLKTVENLLEGDVERKSFDVRQLKNKYKQLVTNRNNDIRDTVEEYSWLEKKKYYDFHQGLLRRYISKSYYLDRIHEKRKEVIKQRLKWVGIVIGVAAGIVLAIIVLRVIVAIVLAIVIISVIARSAR